MERAETGESYRTFWIFLLGGFVITVAIFSLKWIGDVFVSNFFYDNPHRIRNVIEVVVAAPLIASVGALVFAMPALLLGAGLAAIGRGALGSFPIWMLAIILPMCVLFELWWLMQFSAEGEPAPLSRVVLRIVAWEAPVLLACWWWTRRRISN
jgi:hypothetical protein